MAIDSCKAGIDRVAKHDQNSQAVFAAPAKPLHSRVIDFQTVFVQDRVRVIDADYAIASLACNALSSLALTGSPGS
jgi:hypothetical protein